MLSLKLISFLAAKAHAKWFLDIDVQIGQITTLDMSNLFLRAVFDPLVFEMFGHYFEVLDRVVRVYVVVFEILHHHDYVQVQHYVLLEDYENHEDYYVVG